MKLFPAAHATHPQWRMAADLALTQLRAQMAQTVYAQVPTLGLLYITDHYTDDAQEILDCFRAELPQVTDWAGAIGVGIAANNVEYFDEPALSLMLCDLPADQYRIFSGIAPFGQTGRAQDTSSARFRAYTALVHADTQMPDLPELINDLAARTATGYLFGGLSSARGARLQFALGSQETMTSDQGLTSGVFSGGLSGVVFGEGVRLVSRVTQGCQPISHDHLITEATGNLLLRIDDEPALDVLLAELDVSLAEPQQAIAAVRATLVGLADPGHDGGLRRTGDLGPNVLVRHIIGLDTTRRGIAIADRAEAGTHITFCRRNAQAARADLMRICAEVREELEPEKLPLEMAALVTGGTETVPHPTSRIAGAVYVSCVGRGGPHFGAPSAELQIVRHALGDVPLTGFFAGGEIARNRLHGYTGVLTVFVTNSNQG